MAFDALQFFSGYTSTQIKLQAGFQHFDSFPPVVKQAFWQLTVTFDPVPVGLWLRAHVTPQDALVAVELICAAEKDDLLVFGHNYRARFGAPLPHLAAQATIQRYGAFAAT